MAEVTNDLIYEVLKAVQQDVRRIDRKTDELRAELHAVRTHVLGVQQDIANSATLAP